MLNKISVLLLKELDNSFNEKQGLLTNQMQKIEEAIERANLVNKNFNYFVLVKMILFSAFSHWNFPIVYLKILQQLKF